MTENEVLWSTVLLLFGAASYLYVQLLKSRRNLRRLEIEKKVLLATTNSLEAERLKFQVQPHTVNNLLATMSVMSKRLNQGITSLGDTLEYVLYKGERQLVSVEEEIKFVERFLAMNDVLSNSMEQIKLDLDSLDKQSRYYTTPSIPHLATACFLENAFKHGDITHPEFLHVRMKLDNEGFEFHVDNRARVHASAAPGGIGIKNLSRRLELLLPERHSIFCERRAGRHVAGLIIKFNHAETEGRHS